MFKQNVVGLVLTWLECTVNQDFLDDTQKEYFTFNINQTKNKTFQKWKFTILNSQTVQKKQTTTQPFSSSMDYA